MCNINVVFDKITVISLQLILIELTENSEDVWNHNQWKITIRYEALFQGYSIRGVTSILKLEILEASH